MKRIIALLFTALVLAVFCAAQTDPGYNGRGSFREEGIASWYGAEFAGLATASGEPFDPSAFTAAHPSLPFGTLLRITNRHNNRQVVVRVNDRGPFVPARILDVSRAAAEQLDMIATGTAPVLVELTDAAASGGIALVQTQPPVQQIYQQIPQQTQPPVRTGTVNLEQYAQPNSGIAAQTPIYQSLPSPANSQNPPIIYDSLSPVTAASIQQQPAPVYQSIAAAPPSAVTQLALSPETGVIQQQSAPVYQSLPAAPPPQVTQNTAPAPNAPGSDLLWSLPEETPPAVQPAAVKSAAPAAAASKPASSSSRAVIKPGIPPAGQNRRYRLQVGSFKIPKNATEVFEKLKKAGLNPAYERSGEYYRVVLAGIKADEVPSVADKLGAAGFMEAIIREEK